QRARNAGRDALRTDADRRNVPRDRPMAEVGRKREAMNAVDPGRSAGLALEKLERRPDKRMIRLCKLRVAFGHEVIAPELDVRLERGEFRPLAPVDREAGRQDQDIEAKFSACRIEQYAAIPDLDRAGLAARQNRKVAMAGDAEHRITRRRHR